jgi:hypothetical protein
VAGHAADADEAHGLVERNRLVGGLQHGETVPFAGERLPNPTDKEGSQPSQGVTSSSKDDTEDRLSLRFFFFFSKRFHTRRLCGCDGSLEGKNLQGEVKKPGAAAEPAEERHLGDAVKDDPFLLRVAPPPGRLQLRRQRPTGARA